MAYWQCTSNRTKSAGAETRFLSVRSADGVSLPHLIVVPLSTVTNWEREFALWAAHLNVVTLVGNAAARDTIREHELYAKQDGHGKQSRDRASLQVPPERERCSRCPCRYTPTLNAL